MGGNEIIEEVTPMGGGNIVVGGQGGSIDGILTSVGGKIIEVGEGI
ncbi:unnamed protein product [Anisakis simplex]|uniref:Uncharacterized protein n=1 Tax=Anisakis simplex TaxID=6269 RepID=A0A0M3J933_ANISI|nr:unnamed protein product [Anisakis simplex]